MHSKFFKNKNLIETNQQLRTARRNYQIRCTPTNENVSKEQQGIFRSLLMEKSNKWINSLLDEINKAFVQNFCEKVNKVWKINKSQGIATLENESGLFFENREEAELLMDTFFTGKHMTKFNFDSTFYDSSNEGMEQRSALYTIKVFTSAKNHLTLTMPTPKC